MATAIHRAFNLDSRSAGDRSRPDAPISMLEDAAGSVSV
jgi:hypothetical protein